MLRFQAGISMPGSQFLKVNLAGEAKVKDKKQYSNAVLRSLIFASTWGCLFTFKRPYLTYSIFQSHSNSCWNLQVYTATKEGLSPSIPWNLFAYLDHHCQQVGGHRIVKVPQILKQKNPEWVQNEQPGFSFRIHPTRTPMQQVIETNSILVSIQRNSFCRE